MKGYSHSKGVQGFFRGTRCYKLNIYEPSQIIGFSRWLYLELVVWIVLSKLIDKWPLKQRHYLQLPLILLILMCGYYVNRNFLALIFNFCCGGIPSNKS